MHELRFKSVGTGRNVVILLNEWMGDHSNYYPILPYLDKDTYRWIFTDLRGYGLSKHILGEFTCREAADDVLNLAERLQLKSFHLVGHSMSSMVTQRVAADVPNRVKVLVNVTPVPASGISLPSDSINFLKNVVNDNDCAMRAINERTGGRYNDSWLSVKLSIARQASSIQARIGYLEMFLNTDFSQDVIGLKVPVRVIVGEHDIPVFKEDHVRKIYSELFPNLRIVKFRESGHYPMLECPILFASTLEKFFSEFHLNKDV